MLNFPGFEKKNPGKNKKIFYFIERLYGLWGTANPIFNEYMGFVARDKSVGVWCSPFTAI